MISLDFILEKIKWKNNPELENAITEMYHKIDFDKYKNLEAEKRELAIKEINEELKKQEKKGNDVSFFNLN